MGWDTSNHRHHTGDHCQDSWHHHGRQTSNGALDCHWVGYFTGPHPWSHPQRIILLIWLPLTTSSSQKWKRSSVVIILRKIYHLMNAVDHFVRYQNDAFYTERVHLFHDRWTKCIKVEWDYVAKWLHLIFQNWLLLRTYQSTLVGTVIQILLLF